MLKSAVSRKWSSPNSFFRLLPQRPLSSKPAVLEIERKFICTPELLNSLSSMSSHVESISFIDTYFDDAQYTFTTKDMWLRRRNDKFELKWPFEPQKKNKGSDLSAEAKIIGLDFYNESTDWTAIARELNLQSEHKLKSQDFNNKATSDIITKLKHHGINSFGIFETERLRHLVAIDLDIGGANLNIDIDRVSFKMPGNDSVLDSYLIGEIELIDTNLNTKHAEREDINSAVVMLKVFTSLGISPRSVRGKVLEYLHKYRPNHYHALELSGVIGSKLG